jgi:nicotinamidase-related amidase
LKFLFYLLFPDVSLEKKMTKKTALILIDFINDIVSPQGKIATSAPFIAEHQIIQKANAALAYARASHWFIILVKVGFTPGYPEKPKNSPIFATVDHGQALLLGEWGTQFHKDLKTLPTDYIVVKSRISPFYATNLDMVLRANTIERLVMGGVSSSWAIQGAVRDAHDRDYEVLILEDSCGAATLEEHQLSMQQLSRIAKLITTPDLSEQ